MIRLRVLAEGIYLFPLVEFTARTVYVFVSADKDGTLPKAELCSWVPLLMCLVLHWQPDSDDVFASLTNDKCIVGSCKHY